MKVTFSARGWADYQHLIKNNQASLAKVNTLIQECARAPFKGLGKPEPLKGEMRGYWSRRITQEDRLVYRVTGTGEEQTLEIMQCRFHY